MNEPLVEKQESVAIQPDTRSSEQSEQPEQASSFSAPEDLEKMETFSEPDTKDSETRRHRKKTQ